jgi:hypothetical protein
MQRNAPTHTIHPGHSGKTWFERIANAKRRPKPRDSMAKARMNLAPTGPCFLPKTKLVTIMVVKERQKIVRNSSILPTVKSRHNLNKLNPAAPL